MRGNDRKSGVFKVTRKMVKTSDDVIGEDKRIAWKSYYENLLNTECA